MRFFRRKTKRLTAPEKIEDYTLGVHRHAKLHIMHLSQERLNELKEKQSEEMDTLEMTHFGLDSYTDLIKQWAVDRNLHTADSNKQMLKLVEEFGELGEGMAKGRTEDVKDALGDMYVVMTILAMQMDIDITECIQMAYNEIKDRKGEMRDGVFVKQADLQRGRNTGTD